MSEPPFDVTELASDLQRRFLQLRAQRQLPVPAPPATVVGTQPTQPSQSIDANELAADLQRRFLQGRQQSPAVSSSSSSAPAPAQPTAPPVAALPKFPHEEAAMKQRLRETMHHCKFYEDEVMLEKARAVVPVERLHAEARQAEAEEGSSFQVNLMKRLLQWFKHEFFTWTNSPSCKFCSLPTRSCGSATATGDELRFGGNRVELYVCDGEGGCNRFTRFPRYNNPGKLLETRTGRCGEWANAFTLISRALGFDSRYVLDWTDHVWTEVYMEVDGETRWIHCDPSEAAFDAPLMYEKGWGKKLSYIFAFSHVECTDVIRRYSRTVDDVTTRRTALGEDALVKVIQQINKENISPLPDPLRAEILSRRQVEKKDLDTCHLRDRPDNATEQHGRTSGSLEWRSARGEMGKGKVTSHLPPPRPTKVGTETFRMPEQPSGGKVDGLSLAGSATVSTLHGAPNPAVSVPTMSVMLTDATPGQIGAAYVAFKVDCARSVAVEFGVRITAQDGGSAEGGADGFAVVLQNDSPSVVGAGGGDLGAKGIRRSLSIMFDTYARKQVTVMASRRQLAYTKRIPILNDGRIYYVKTVLTLSDTAGAHHLELFLADAPGPAVASDSTEVGVGTGSGGRDWVKVVDTAVRLSDVVEGEDFWVGVTAATGGLCQRHEVFGMVVRVDV